MRYGIFSDVHSNFEALHVVLNAFKKEAIDRYICVGDIVGYGPDPSICIQMLSNIGCMIVAGNHDWGASGSLELTNFSQYAAQAINWTKNIITNEERNFLKSLKLEYVNSDLSAVHASYENPESFNYIYQASDTLPTFKSMPGRICFIGHTHIPAVFSFKSEKVASLKPVRIVIEPSIKYIFNVGSVGQPRDGINKACFCIFDTKKKLVEFRRISYNINRVKIKIRKRGLAKFLAERLGQGR